MALEVIKSRSPSSCPPVLFTWVSSTAPFRKVVIESGVQVVISANNHGLKRIQFHDGATSPVLFKKHPDVKLTACEI